MAKEGETYAPPKDLSANAHCSTFEQYESMYKESVENPSVFWGKIAEEFYWKTPPNKDEFMNYNFDVNKGPISINWMAGGITNVCYNLLDRNVKEKNMGSKICFYWEGNYPNDSRSITYGQMLIEVCKFANVLKQLGVSKGDRVAIYMPQIVETVVAMLACARIGAIHSVVFGGFSAPSLATRLQDATCCMLIAADGCWRGNKLLNLKQIVDNALNICKQKDMAVKTCIMVRHVSCAPGQSDFTVMEGKRPTKLPVSMVVGRDVWWDELMADASPDCEPTWLDAEDPLFLLYTSGSTGKPKGVLHTCAGYLLYTATTFKYVFDYHPGDVFWCTADVGWITGHSYVVYGPMANGATSVMFEGTPFFPTSARFWEVCEKYRVSKFYTAPTAIRSLMKFGPEPVKSCRLESLRVLGTVGEPINPEAWLWYHKVVGGSRCAIVDTFWQTETGGHVITPLPGAIATKPGSATFPFFGVVPELLDDEGRVIQGEGEGFLVFKQPWPGIMRTIYGNQARFESTYFKRFAGYYCTGDGARRDSDGYLWITGRTDDMMNMSGHLLSTAEVESALVTHDAVAEAAVVAHPHPIKGDCLYCFVTLKQNEEFTDDIIKELKQIVRKRIGPFATPDFIQDAPALPKTRSGKIMRRVLRKICVGDHELGDISTMADTSVIDDLFKRRPKDA